MYNWCYSTCVIHIDFLFFLPSISLVADREITKHLRNLDRAEMEDQKALT